VVDRRFWAGYGRQADFEEVFGAGGLWARLLYKAPGYLGTEIWCEVPESLQYRVRDFWTWHRDYERFRAGFHAEFDRFEEWIRSESLIAREQFLGAYYEKFEDGSEEGLVLS
jgi:hypothetical protein